MTPEDRSSELTAREKHLQRRIKELTTLYEVSKILTSALSLDKALEAICQCEPFKRGWYAGVLEL